MELPPVEVRRAGAEDAPEVGRLLHEFNSEFEDPSPGPERMAERVAALIAAGEVTVLLAGDASAPDGLALFRVRPALWSLGEEVYLEELYVVPGKRGKGVGRALMEATIEAARELGAGRIDLGTGEGDTAARGLYESLGFSNAEGDGSRMLFYERDL